MSPCSQISVIKCYYYWYKWFTQQVWAGKFFWGIWQNNPNKLFWWAFICILQSLTVNRRWPRWLQQCGIHSHMVTIGHNPFLCSNSKDPGRETEWTPEAVCREGHSLTITISSHTVCGHLYHIISIPCVNNWTIAMTTSHWWRLRGAVQGCKASKWPLSKYCLSSN